MLRILLERHRQGHRTTEWPRGPAPELPTHFRGEPSLDTSLCPSGCQGCVAACPTNCITLQPEVRIDLGACLFCMDCAEACPEGAVTFGRDFSLAASERDALIRSDTVAASVQALDAAARKLFGHSLRLRQVSAGGCGACEADTNVLGTVGWDIGRFGVQFVASPRHADGLLITGAITENMEPALRAAWDAIPSPKIAIAVGACAISGGPFAGNPEVRDGVGDIVPIDLYVPGCPPHPLTILDGILRLLGRLDGEASGSKAI